ncbi:hypothetical protein HYALB_00010620 [Hymenoscyphus albidus]|uniref:Uncharacterized protein n=1 Tax=Hymenoscyphus albidus TaxID=595503 RepID=A0A9N9Q622_9HELO|nr:hypothetical protein HYALB_00010620 [Hymenoscyphus albidus]
MVWHDRLFKGPSGPKGDQGNPGPTGSVGPVGPSGPSGASGAKGDQGDAGPTGSVGPIGPSGPSGASGAKGDQGDIGPTGSVGPVGPSGPSGASGAKGDQGDGRLDLRGRPDLREIKENQGQLEALAPQDHKETKANKVTDVVTAPTATATPPPVQPQDDPGYGTQTCNQPGHDMGFEVTPDHPTLIPWTFTSPADTGVQYNFSVPSVTDGSDSTPFSGQQTARIRFTGTGTLADFHQDNIILCEDSDYTFTASIKRGSKFAKSDCHIDWSIGGGPNDDTFRSLGRTTLDATQGTWQTHTGFVENSGSTVRSWTLNAQFPCDSLTETPFGSLYFDNFSITKGSSTSTSPPTTLQTTTSSSSSSSSSKTSSASTTPTACPVAVSGQTCARKAFGGSGNPVAYDDFTDYSGTNPVTPQACHTKCLLDSRCKSFQVGEGTGTEGACFLYDTLTSIVAANENSPYTFYDVGYPNYSPTGCPGGTRKVRRNVVERAF